MFTNLKSKTHQKSNYHNLPTVYPSGLRNFHSPARSNGTPTQSPIKPNEGDRLVRCRICGFPCDKERDVKGVEGSWAGFGIDQGVQLTAGTSIGDKRVPTAGSVSTSPDKYYARTIVGGCPSCGSLTYYLED